MPDPSTAIIETVTVNGIEQTIQVYGPFEVLHAEDLTAAEARDQEIHLDRHPVEGSWFRVPLEPEIVAKGVLKHGSSETHELYDLGDFSADWGITQGSGHPYPGWDGYLADSAFSACLVRYCDEEGSSDAMGTLETDYVMFGRVSW